jgi:putative hydrolase of the HAD superfamily
MQKQYYREHGTTLNGLMQVHGMEPERYLDYVHRIDLTPVPPDPALDAALASLPGRKVIFTNGSVAHAENVMRRLGVERHFSDIFDIVATDYRPKPSADAYAALIAALGIEAKRAAMFEDLKRNLVPAAKIGMTTVWVAHDHEWSRQGPETPDDVDAHVHHVAHDLARFLGHVQTEAAHEPA